METFRAFSVFCSFRAILSGCFIQPVRGIMRLRHRRAIGKRMAIGLHALLDDVLTADHPAQIRIRIHHKLRDKPCLAQRRSPAQTRLARISRVVRIRCRTNHGGESALAHALCVASTMPAQAAHLLGEERRIHFLPDYPRQKRIPAPQTRLNPAFTIKPCGLRTKPLKPLLSVFIIQGSTLLMHHLCS